METGGRMKLILSRKGFDSAAGGVPSPIFPDGRMLSLPIPDNIKSGTKYVDIFYNGKSLGPLIEQLASKIKSHAHLDPDLVKESLQSREDGWRPIFGQSGAAQGHLHNNDISTGDLFLFFGLFLDIKEREGVYTRVPKSKPRHVIWGWMQVDKVLHLGINKPDGYKWAEYHPHFRSDEPNNVVYIAKPQLEINGIILKDVPGAGVLPRYSSELQLTAQDADKVTDWELPGWFYPGESRKPLTFHPNLQRSWNLHGNRTKLKAASRGQEFIIDSQEYPEAISWACDLITNHSQA
jgi:hypothetical protein